MGLGGWTGGGMGLGGWTEGGMRLGGWTDADATSLVDEVSGVGANSDEIVDSSLNMGIDDNAGRSLLSFLPSSSEAD